MGVRVMAVPWPQLGEFGWPPGVYGPTFRDTRAQILAFSGMKPAALDDAAFDLQVQHSLFAVQIHGPKPVDEVHRLSEREPRGRSVRVRGERQRRRPEGAGREVAAAVRGECSASACCAT